MPKFVLADEVPDLEFDLSPHGPAGVVPEPTSPQVDRWTLDMADIVAESAVEIPENASLLDRAIAAKEAAARNPKLNELALDAYARLCGAREVTNPSKAKGAPAKVWKGGCPTRDELAALPARPRDAFMGWLAGHLSPERSPAATTS
jgi:hypothetical protein